MAVARLLIVSLALFSASSVLITSECSALISTPIYCAAWLRAASSAESLPSSSELTPSLAPEKKSVSPDEGALASHPGGLGCEAVLTAAFSPAQAKAKAASRTRPLFATSGLPGNLVGEALCIGLQPFHVVELGEHRDVVRELVGLVDHVVGLVVLGRVFVAEAEVPIALGHLRGLELHVLLRILHGGVEGLLHLLPVAALGVADAAFELRDVGILGEV